MLFNSYIFIFLFLPITFIGFFTFAKFRLTQLALTWLIITSLFFYSYWNLFPSEGQYATPQYLLLIILSLIFNHQIGAAITASNPPNFKAKILLWIGITLNISIIAYYKYANFLFSSINPILNTEFHLDNLVLPLGISFYTFTQIAYLVDAYKGETQNRPYNLPTYGLFIIYFPHLIAGPIVRHNELIPQFSKLRNFVFSHKNLAIGLTIFCLGLSKKVLIADNLSPWVATVFSHAHSVNFLEAWIGALSYTLQLYFDFSGYSEMAIGLALMFNIILPINFDSPYKATSISDFWRRWHITLSNFLRDYLYIPLGGSRRGETRRYANLMITMLLGGLWHGAGWTFVIWGGLHGLYLSINHGWRKLNIPLPKLLAWIITFLAVIIGWVFFRSQTLADGLEILKTMFGFKGIILPGEAQGKLAFLKHLGLQMQSWNKFNYLPSFNGSQTLAIGALISVILGTLFLPNTQQMVEKFKPNWWWAMGIGLLTSFCLLSLNHVSEFLYFQF